MISPSLPEPLCDVLAQLRALANPLHPKDAVWLARGTPLAEIIAIRGEDGLLLTTSHEKAEQFEADPSDETLGTLLGCVEPKWSINGHPVVVQACDVNGYVITEMLASDHKVAASIAAAGKHGSVLVTTLQTALARRLKLRAEEMPDAA